MRVFSLDMYLQFLLTEAIDKSNNDASQRVNLRDITQSELAEIEIGQCMV